MKGFRINRLQAVLVAVAAAVLMLTVSLTTMAGGGPGLSSTSGACVPPQVAAYIIGYQYYYLFQDSGIGDDQEECTKACTKALKACRDAVKASKRCIDKFAKHQNGVLSAACRSQSFRGSEGYDTSDECDDDAKALKSIEREFAEDSKEVGIDLCQTFEDECENLCQPIE